MSPLVMMVGRGLQLGGHSSGHFRVVWLHRLGEVGGAGVETCKIKRDWPTAFRNPSH